jgi:hypothetical protein
MNGVTYSIKRYLNQYSSRQTSTKRSMNKITPDLGSARLGPVVYVRFSADNVPITTEVSITLTYLT